ncbi:asparagine synthase (glutamine-hydrolyzing) [Silanimonas sp.]|jgi:asparagine synthase (glutamine-hydrolysing)|uniref:asparagine synthase (glutamine-hydrolyzing) n=1 Tax=Silanimonas sp. TaxID=1929290 RepID=UPI0037C4FC1B
MCGIVGFAAAPGRVAPESRVGEAMNAAIVHRGPDDGGVHREDAVLLGMRRLAIIDLGGGHQPMTSADGQRVLVFNGEIYNFRRLRAELQALGHRFRTDSDSEVILVAYEAWGEAAVARLEGMFAFALWDRARGQLLLARDRLGKKPLFLWDGPDGIGFASELKSLLALPGFRREVDAGVLPGYFAFGYVPSPRSIFRDVRKLPAGHYAVWRDGRLREERYWALDFSPTFRGTEAEAVEQLHERLQAAVDDRLVADVPFGAFLSGGLDSSVVVALMAQRMTQPVKTFSIGFKEARYSELSGAKRVADLLGTDHHELVVEPEATELIETLVWHLDEPFADSSALPTFLVSELARPHVKMVLSGDGGDEAFAGYERYLKFLALERLGPLRGAAALGLRAAGGVLPGLFGQRLRRVGQRLGERFPDSYLSGVALSRPDQMLALLGPAGAEGYASLHPLFPAGDTRPMIDRIVDADIRSYLLDDILVKLDRMTMAASIEGRAPLLDHRVVEFAVRLPAHLRVRGGRGKHVLREVARRWLPSDVLDKPKQGFAIPLPEWFRAKLGAMAGDVFASRAFRERGWVQPAIVDGLLAEHRSGGADHAEPLWQVLVLELWARRFMDMP